MTKRYVITINGNEMDKIINMSLQSLHSRLPIVYTTRLDDMAIFRKDLSKTKAQDIIESIIFESKPHCGIIDSTNNSNTLITKYERVSYKQSNDRSKSNCKLSFENFKSKLKQMKHNSREIDKKTEIFVKSEIETDLTNGSRNKLENLLALCKPLKVVLEDINKTRLKTNEISEEVLSISSDSDDDIIINGQKKLVPVIKNTTTKSRNVMTPAAKHTINNVDDFKDFLNRDNLQNSVIVINNLYLEELDAYYISYSNDVTEYETRKYSDAYSFPMGNCKCIINIMACCWKNRQTYVSLLLKFKQYTDIAKFIETTHPCNNRCTCCCFYLQTNSKTPYDTIKSPQSAIITTDSLLINNPPISSSSELIDNALKFQKKSKWKGYPARTHTSNDKSKHNQNSCNKFLQINNTKGEVEFYEFGFDNLLYSKVINSNINDLSWLPKTLNRCKNHINFTFTDPLDRERKIITYRHLENMISFNTECFLRIPSRIEVSQKNKNATNGEILKMYKIEHTRSFIEASNKKSKILSIVSQINKNNITASSNAQIKRAKNSYIPPEDKPIKPQIAQQTIMEHHEHETINRLIKDILHRFSNVVLTINSQGKVAAALNAPLSSLTYSELNILSQILNHAQNQVDTLGLTPGTCLNPDTLTLINSPHETSIGPTDNTTPHIFTTAQIISTNSNNASNSKNSDSLQNESIKRKQKTNDNIQSTLRSFSTTLGNKKKDYEQSFRSYLCDKLETTPKITNVFSLKDNSSFTNFSKDPLRKSDAMTSDRIEIGNNLNTSADILNDPKILTKLCMNEIKNNITVLDKEESVGGIKRKHKGSLKCNIKPPKIRVKTAAEILVENSASVETPLVCRNFEIVGGGSAPSFPSSLILNSDLNYFTNNTRLHNLLSVDPGTSEVSTAPQQIPQAEGKTYFEVHADGTMVENTYDFPNTLNF